MVCLVNGPSLDHVALHVASVFRLGNVNVTTLHRSMAVRIVRERLRKKNHAMKNHVQVS